MTFKVSNSQYGRPYPSHSWDLVGVLQLLVFEQRAVADSRTDGRSRSTLRPILSESNDYIVAGPVCVVLI